MIPSLETSKKGLDSYIRIKAFMASSKSLIVCEIPLFPLNEGVGGDGVARLTFR